VAQGGQLVGPRGGGDFQIGRSVALSNDGNTAIVGGNVGTTTGAAWVFTRSGSAWSEQARLVVSGGPNSSQYASVSLSADGNTAIIGGTEDNSEVGATWVFTRSGGIWTQQGGKVVGTGNVGQSNQGGALGLSTDASTMVVGGFGDNSNIGAAWVFVQSPTISTVTPNFGTIDGGTSVTIKGTGFTSVTGVTFGGLAATGVTIVDPTTITAVTPAHAQGAVD